MCNYTKKIAYVLPSCIYYRQPQYHFLLVSFSACSLYILDCIHIALILSFLLYACSQSISNAFSCYIHYVTCSVWIGTQHSNCSLWFSFAKGYALEDTPSWMPLVNRVSESNLDNYVNIYIHRNYTKLWGLDLALYNGS